MVFFQTHTLLFIIITFVIAFIFSYIINLIFLKFSRNLGSRIDTIKEIRWSSTSKPSLGGISFYLTFLITFVFLIIIINLLHFHYSNLKIIGILTVCTLAFVMGLADDAYNTKPLLKFLVQFVCGLILYFTNTKINIFTNDTFNFAFTIFWVVGIMNSINMLDNMDGIATIVSIVILFFIVSLNFNTHMVFNPVSFLSLGLLGGLLGFLIFNFHPAKMFMGDTGSQFIGLFLAIIGIDNCWNCSSFINSSWYSVNPILVGFMVVFTVYILPLVDTITVFINRIKIGQSPFIGGKDHTTHHLFFRGFSEKRIAILYFCIQLIGLSLALNLILNYHFAWLILCIIFCSLVFVSLYLNTIIKQK